jgi:hypothetical protein
VVFGVAAGDGVGGAARGAVRNLAAAETAAAGRRGQAAPALAVVDRLLAAEAALESRGRLSGALAAAVATSTVAASTPPPPPKTPFRSLFKCFGRRPVSDTAAAAAAPLVRSLTGRVGASWASRGDAEGGSVAAAVVAADGGFARRLKNDCSVAGFCARLNPAPAATAGRFRLTVASTWSRLSRLPPSPPLLLPRAAADSELCDVAVNRGGGEGDMKGFEKRARRFLRAAWTAFSIPRPVPRPAAAGCWAVGRWLALFVFEKGQVAAVAGCWLLVWLSR